MTSDLSIYYPSISTLWPVHIQNWERKERRARKFARVHGSTSSLTRNFGPKWGGVGVQKKGKRAKRERRMGKKRESLQMSSQQHPSPAPAADASGGSILGKTRRTHLGISQGSLNPLFVGRSSCPQGLEGQSPSSEEINHSNRSVTWQLTQGS